MTQQVRPFTAYMEATHLNRRIGIAPTLTIEPFECPDTVRCTLRVSQGVHGELHGLPPEGMDSAASRLHGSRDPGNKPGQRSLSTKRTRPAAGRSSAGPSRRWRPEAQDLWSNPSTGTSDHLRIGWIASAVGRRPMPPSRSARPPALRPI